MSAPRVPTAEYPLRVLFVCLGNICRSPMAEGVFRAEVASAGLSALVQCDSAGTGDWHIGELADPRTRKTAEAHGLHLTHRARQFTTSDFDEFDYVLCMDNNNLSNVMGQAGGFRLPHVSLFREFDPEGKGEVPDPYFGGIEGFEEGYHLVLRCSRGLIEHLRTAHGLGTT
jgi:protein-tyrosine phosphatase